MLAVGHSDPVYKPVDAADSGSARPAYAGLIYPAVSFHSAGFEDRKSNGLWGESTDAETRARYTPLTRVRPSTPPVFLVHAIDDGTVPILQSFAMIEACRTHNVPVEAHIFEKGGHGFGALHLPADSPGRLWPDLFARWIAKR
jgi:dipeptidyl aminopeptidase/acylaminoacyl peptidase